MRSDFPIPHPCFKWAGGKGDLVKSIDAEGYFPNKISTYYEPFFGAGAVFFYLWRKGVVDKAVLSDINFELINVYRHIQNDPEELIHFSEKINLSSNGDNYYKNRARFNELKTAESPSEEDLLERAILMMYLNRNSYSGMYRENRKGIFNVPCGYYNNPKIIDSENIWAVHDAFKHVTFKCGSYSEVLSRFNLKKTDFIYMDPPYMDCEGVSDFKLYNSMVFDYDSQIALSEYYKKLTENDIKVMMSNSSAEGILTHYGDHSKIHIKEISARRLINQKKVKGRHYVKEYLVMNYEV